MRRQHDSTFSPKDVRGIYTFGFSGEAHGNFAVSAEAHGTFAVSAEAQNRAEALRRPLPGLFCACPETGRFCSCASAETSRNRGHSAITGRPRSFRLMVIM